MKRDAIAESDNDTWKQREAIIIEQNDGISPVYETFYIHSIIYAADRSVAAFQRFETTVAASDSSTLIFATVQEALTHAGALSRFFWPVRKDSPLAAARGRRLCDAFELDDASPLKWRKLRNGFEHFDEDLDRFLLQDPVGIFFPVPLVDDHRLADEATGNIFKLVDPENGVCVLLGEKFEFRSIRREVEQVLTRALEMDEQGCRL